MLKSGSNGMFVIKRDSLSVFDIYKNIKLLYDALYKM
jgi:hypothetical protein